MLTSERIKTAREAVNETQAEFAVRFGVNQSTIARWETVRPPEHWAACKEIERILDEMDAARVAAQ